MTCGRIRDFHALVLTNLTATEPKKFQPSNINFGLFPRLEQKTPKKLRGAHYADRALHSLQNWLAEINSRDV